MTDRQRREFLIIATRQKNELCSNYTMVALGLQAYSTNRSVVANAPTLPVVEEVVEPAAVAVVADTH